MERVSMISLERKARFSPTREKLPWKIELQQLLWAYHDWILRVGFYSPRERIALQDTPLWSKEPAKSF